MQGERMYNLLNQKALSVFLVEKQYDTKKQI